MATIITDLKETFRRGNIYIQLIYINVAVFILTTLTEVMFQLFNRSIAGVFEWLELPASVLRFPAYTQFSQHYQNITFNPSSSTF